MRDDRDVSSENLTEREGGRLTFFYLAYSVAFIKGRQARELFGMNSRRVLLTLSRDRSPSKFFIFDHRILKNLPGYSVRYEGAFHPDPYGSR
jgi:hypothetical protein